MFKTLIPAVLLVSVVAAADIECLDVGQTATAQWVDKTTKQTCTWTGTVGVNFGTNPRNGKP